MKEKFLPIGTVVLLKGATKKLMITGYCSAVAEDVNKIYDYVAILYPEGSFYGDEVALFDHEQIGSILHSGLVNEEFNDFDKLLKDSANDITEAVSNTKVDTLPPLTPENLGNILNQLKSQSSALAPISEPTAFSDVVNRSPVFGPKSTLSTDPETNEKSSNSIQDAEISMENLPVGDGKPVLQLEPIFNESNDSSDDSTSAPAVNSTIPGLTRL